MKLPRWIRRLFGLDRPASYDAWMAQEKRSIRVAALWKSIGHRALERAKQLNIAAVPANSPKRTIDVTEDEFREAADLGFQQLCGLTLVRPNSPQQQTC